tara:strand:+ start:236 stop:877 length:642 start_codon:yes stop_codon:yes gene_type:complete
MINYKIKIYDNFLEIKDLKDLTAYAKNLNNDRNIHVFHNQIDINNKILNASIDKDFLIRLNTKYLDKAIRILKELNKEKAKLINYSDFTIIKTKKNKKFPIHDDTYNKLLSGVIYLYPEKNIGTIFYNTKNGSDKNVIDWKINRAVFFSRKERETWHSYEADNKNDRITLIFNLMTKEENYKKVLEIEKRNYFIGKLRHKINPYLYRFFHFTI